ncbi:hypothetical protein G6M50_10635 [Agrobacterium rhizogenes]|nr:hypothetical protein [Rhizobium rhizogenes]NTJ78240.1 hypothetical protein [Rhizobium rhizogenes]
MGKPVETVQEKALGRRVLYKIAEGDFRALGDTSMLADRAVFNYLVANGQTKGDAA